MEISAALGCPYCGASMESVVDSSLPDQRFITDCEVCCRPFEVVLICEPGEIVSLETLAS